MKAKYIKLNGEEFEIVEYNDAMTPNDDRRIRIESNQYDKLDEMKEARDSQEENVIEILDEDKDKIVEYKNLIVDRLQRTSNDYDGVRAVIDMKVEEGKEIEETVY